MPQVQADLPIIDIEMETNWHHGTLISYTVVMVQPEIQQEKQWTSNAKWRNPQRRLFCSASIHKNCMGHFRSWTWWICTLYLFCHRTLYTSIAADWEYCTTSIAMWLPSLDPEEFSLFSKDIGEIHKLWLAVFCVLVSFLAFRLSESIYLIN